MGGSGVSPWSTPGVRARRSGLGDESGFSRRDCIVYMHLHTDVLSEVSRLNASARLRQVGTRLFGGCFGQLGTRRSPPWRSRRGQAL